MAETYSGFVAPKRVDWEALSNKLAEKVTGVGEAVQKERTDLDKIASDNITKMNEIDQSKNQTFGDMVLTFQNDGRNMVNAWNASLKAGQLSPAEYRKKINNLNEYTGILAGSAKTFDARIEEVMKRQQDGTASTFELELLNDFGSLAEMKDAKFNVSQDGSIMYSKIDPKTGQISSDLKDVRALNLPQNIQDNKIVVTDSVKALTGNWNMLETFKDLGRGGELTTASIKNQPRYKDMKAAVVKSILTTPRATLGVLADNGGMIPVFYTTDADYKKKRAEEIAEITEQNRIANRPDTSPTKEQLDEIDFNMVKKTIGPDGTINPELTPAQRTRAEEMVDIEIDGQMETKVTGQARQAYGGGGGGGGGKTPEKQEFATYEVIKNAFDLSKTDPKRSAEMLTNLTGARYDIAWGSGGLQIRGFLDDGTVDKLNPIAVVKSGQELAPFIYGSTGAAGSADALNQYNREKESYMSSGKSSAASTPEKITQAEFNKKWATLKPGQTLVGADGVTYKKK
jgi:hypothetical protein